MSRPTRAEVPSVTTADDWATLLDLREGDPAHAVARVAAFLRTCARRMRLGEQWDVPETMASAYESCAGVLDDHLRDLATASEVRTTEAPSSATVRSLREQMEFLALRYHKGDNGEGEYGCPGLTCPGVQRLLGFAASVALALVRTTAMVPSAVEVRPGVSVAARSTSVFVVHHGLDCDKKSHATTRTGYLHDAADDSPYDVDGVLYCGRCHQVL